MAALASLCEFSNDGPPLHVCVSPRDNPRQQVFLGGLEGVIFALHLRRYGCEGDVSFPRKAQYRAVAHEHRTTLMHDAVNVFSRDVIRSVSAAYPSQYLAGFFGSTDSMAHSKGSLTVSCICCQRCSAVFSGDIFLRPRILDSVRWNLLDGSFRFHTLHT